MKRCSGCGKEKPLEAYYFENGRPRSKCKECHRAKVYERSPERRREIDSKSKAKHADKIKAKHNKRWAEKRDEINAARRAARAEDPERFRAVTRAWWAENSGQIAERRRAYYATVKDKVQAQLRADRKSNPEKHRRYERTRRERHGDLLNARAREYYAENKQQWNVYRRRREARLAEVDYLPYTRDEIFKRDGGRCRGCHAQLEDKPRAFQIDHIVPISLGGPDIPANVQLMCPKCNRAKWANLEGQIHLPV